jgi:phosphatidate cytidylyltransferase
VEAFHICCTILSFISLNELFGAFEKKGYKPLRISGYLSCLCLLLGSIGTWNRHIYSWLISVINFIDVWAILYFALILMFAILVFGRGKYSVTDLSVTILSSFYICFLFWHLIMLRNLPRGMYVVWFVIIGAVATDTFAYFAGTYLGKNKLIPDVSPNKTVEGSIGGVLGCLLAILIYGLFFRVWAYDIAIWKLCFMGLTCGLVSQIGDLAGSAIKRFCGIKDFGRIIPGHGGVLDRLDSVLILAPLIYIFVS